METEFMTMLIKIEIQQVLKNLYSVIDKTSPKLERKIFNMHMFRPLITGCLFSTNGELICSNTRIIASRFCNKHTKLCQDHNIKQYFLSQEEYLLHQLHQFKPLSIDNYDHLPTYEEYIQYYEQRKNEYFRTIIASVLNDFYEHTDIIKKYVIAKYGEGFLPQKKKKVVQKAIILLPFCEEQCWARINTGRQCINKKFQGLNYCKLHKKSQPYGNYNGDIVKIDIEKDIVNIHFDYSNKTIIKYNDTKSFIAAPNQIFLF